MKKVQCTNKHYYDADIYAVCPHCGAGQMEGSAAPAAAAPQQQAEAKPKGKFKFFGSHGHQTESPAVSPARNMPHTENGRVLPGQQAAPQAAPQAVPQAAPQVQPVQPVQPVRPAQQQYQQYQRPAAQQPAAPQQGQQGLQGQVDMLKTRSLFNLNNQAAPQAQPAQPAAPQAQQNVPPAQPAAPKPQPVTPQPPVQPAAPGQANMPVQPAAPVQPVPQPRPNIPQQSAPMGDPNTGKTIGFFNGGGSNNDPVVGWLVCLKGANMGASFELAARKNTIGRFYDNDVVLENEPQVSRESHAIINFDYKKSDFYLLPSNGDNPYVNDEIVLAARKLEKYDKIEIGGCVLMFVPLCGEDFSWNDYIGKE